MDSDKLKINVGKKEICINKDEVGNIKAQDILDKAGYDVRDYDLYPDAREASRLEPDKPVEIRNGDRYNPIRRSNQYG